MSSQWWCVVLMAGLAGCSEPGCGDPQPRPVSALPTASAPEPPSAVEPDAGLAAPDVRVVAASGRVEVRRGEAELEQWKEIRTGDSLGETDAVRTFDDSRLELQVSEIRVTVEERSELKVKTVTDTVLRAQFKGRVGSELKEGSGQAVEFEAEGTDAVIRSEGGAFSMAADGNGVVAVAAVSGKVDFSARGKTVSVAAGQQSRSVDDKAPQKPKESLKGVLLAVVWPADRETRFKVVPVKGQVEPGSRVEVQGQPARVDKQGRFSARVRLREGKQTVAVVAVDVLGRRKSLDATLFHDGRAPHVDLRKKPWE